MAAAGGVPATKQEDSAAGHGGRFSRRALAAMGAGAAGGETAVCRDPQAWLCRKLRLADEIPGALAGGARCCRSGFPTRLIHAPLRCAAYFAARRSCADEQAETGVEWQAARDGRDSEAPLSGLCRDATPGAELPRHPVRRQDVQLKTMGRESGSQWA